VVHRRADVRETGNDFLEMTGTRPPEAPLRSSLRLTSEAPAGLRWTRRAWPAEPGGSPPGGRARNRQRLLGDDRRPDDAL